SCVRSIAVTSTAAAMALIPSATHRQSGTHRRGTDERCTSSSFDERAAGKGVHRRRNRRRRSRTGLVLRLTLIRSDPVAKLAGVGRTEHAVRPVRVVHDELVPRTWSQAVVIAVAGSVAFGIGEGAVQ